jgi:hypothetical protein
MTFSLLYQRRWNHLDDPALGFMRGFSESIMRMEGKYPNLLPDLRRGSIIFVGSDYSGQHDLARYESFSFLFADLERCGFWEAQRRRLRQRFLPDGRRLSYKNLNDRRRKRALQPFLEAANAIPGLLVTILYDKAMQSVFYPRDQLDIDDPELSECYEWGSVAFDKLIRAIHLVSFFLAGLSRPNQDLLWITDEDDIIPNEQRLRKVVKLFANVSSHYLKHNLRHARIGTTKSDTGSRDIEDLIAVADLAAGALSQLLTDYQKTSNLPFSALTLPPPDCLPRKAKEVLNWFADHTQPLKRMVYLIDEEPDSFRLRLTYLRLHGLRDFAA